MSETEPTRITIREQKCISTVNISTRQIINLLVQLLFLNMESIKSGDDFYVVPEKFRFKKKCAGFFTVSNNIEGSLRGKILSFRNEQTMTADAEKKSMTKKAHVCVHCCKIHGEDQFFCEGASKQCCWCKV